jgi:O-antigen/teichoic acid export membrane protein|tara:strand:+ start:934 stop:2253 length:1320 start_codon:yes stop_codon:yes gene_type:complete
MNRNIIQKKNILFGITFKGISIFLNFLVVPILILFLGKIEYGVWITIFSIVNWIFTFDLGIGQGLRNKLTEALSVNDNLKASQIISTSYIFISIFSLVILLIGIGFIYFVNFQDLLNYKGKSNLYLENFVFLSLFFTIVNFTLSLYKNLYLAVHKSFMVELINVFFQTFYLIVILIWLHFNLEKSLINLILIFGVINFIVSVIATFVFFKIQEKVSFSFINFNLKEGRLLFKLGGKFFIINISLLVILSTDNIIISNLLGPSFVTDYFTIQKVFQVLIVVFTVVLSSSWGLYSEALTKKDFNWIKGNLKKMNIYFLGILIFGVFIFYFIEDILNIWIGEDLVIIPKGLAFCNLLYTFIFCFTNIYMFFINASNKINLQMYLYIFGALINIPLSIFLVRLLGSSTGVIMSTLLCFLPLLIIMPIQSNKIIKNLEKESLKK